MIVVDDNGTDEMARVVAESVSRTPFPVKVVASAHRGEAQVANEGAALATEP